MIIKGKIEQKNLAVSKNNTQYATFQVDKLKFNTFDGELISNFNIGDMVEIETEKKGIYENLKTMKKIDTAPSNPQIQPNIQSPEVSNLTLFLQEISIQLKRIADSLEKK